MGGPPTSGGFLAATPGPRGFGRGLGGWFGRPQPHHPEGGAVVQPAPFAQLEALPALMKNALSQSVDGSDGVGVHKSQSRITQWCDPGAGGLPQRIHPHPVAGRVLYGTSRTTWIPPSSTAPSQRGRGCGFSSAAPISVLNHNPPLLLGFVFAWKVPPPPQGWLG